MIPSIHSSNGRALVSGLANNRVRPVFDRLFEDLVAANPAVAWRGFPSSLWEDENAVHFEMDVPGFAESDLDIMVHGEELLIRGERKSPEASGRGDQRVYGKFEQRVTLPAPVDLERIQAHLVNGVLSLRLPKSQVAKPFKIAIQQNVPQSQVTWQEPTPGTEFGTSSGPSQQQ
ncbi:MAG: molecular chaperone Hsp20 [Planctomyces sp.]|nr:molecular chaperone Hsp20 [Planctomyces sp.]